MFLEVLRLCQKAGLVQLGPVALDGTPIKANASRRRNGSYERLSEREKELAQQGEQILAEAERADRVEEERFGSRRGDELPPELAPREKRLETIRQAPAELERQARQEAEQKKAEIERRLREREQPAAPACRGPWRGRHPAVPDPATAPPEPKAMINLTDAESRIQRERTSGGFLPGFPAPAAVDSQNQIIVAAAVTPPQTDRAQWAPMVQPREQNSGAQPEKVSADTGSTSPPPVPAPSREGMARYGKPDDPPKVKESKVASRAGPKQAKPPRSGYGPDGIPRRDPRRAKLAPAEGQAIYAKRREIVEPVFGQIQQGRGLRQFLRRGLEKTRAAWRWIGLPHNLLKLYRSGGSPPTAYGAPRGRRTSASGPPPSRTSAPNNSKRICRR